MNGTANVRQEPTARDYKLRLTVPDGGNRQRPVTLFNRGYVGTWKSEIAPGVTAEVKRVGGRLVLTLRRGETSAGFVPVTVNVSPFEATYFVDGGWLPGGPAMVFLTY